MRIRNLRVSNFLSFAPTPNDFRIDFSQDNLHVLVGPNGAGKSNVFRAIKVILDSLLWNPPTYFSVDVKNLFHQYGGQSENLKIILGVSIDAPLEKELISCFLKSALVNYEGQLFQGVSMSDGSLSPGINVSAEKSAAYANLIDCAFDRTSIDGLLQGIIEVLAYSSEPYIRSARFLAERGGLEVELLPSGGEIKVLNSVHHQKGMSLVNAWIDGFDDETKVKFKQYLVDERSDPPILPKFRIKLLRDALQTHSASANAKIGNVYTPIEKNVDRLYTLLGGWKNSTEHLTLAHIFRFLLTHGIALLDKWSPRTSSPIDADYHPFHSLTNGDLALHLFRLKNGSQDDREIFLSIQNMYKDITGTGLNVVMRTDPQQDQNGQKVNLINAELVVDRDIPLSYAGSGRGQVALLVSAMYLPHGVILLDEPDIFLHPSIQASLIDSWKNRKVQSVIITHSPYMVPIGGLEHVRRVFINPKSISSGVSPKFSTKQIKELGIQRQIKRADEAMFLFAKCVVLVEGYDEHIALPIWFDKWLKKRGRPSSEALGVRFHAAFGKTGVMPLARVADAYGIEWVALFDADIMSANSRHGNDNQKIIQQFIDAKQVDEDVLQLGTIESLGQFPLGPRQQIFVRGTELGDNWETMTIYKEYKKKLSERIGGGPIISKYMAEEEDPPAEFEALFRRIYELVEPL